jgi:titin
MSSKRLVPVTVKTLLAASLVALLLPFGSSAETGAPEFAPAAVFTVNATTDPGDGNCNAANCTLREAIIAANANGATNDTIRFDIPGAGPHVITLAAALQPISQPVDIDGLTQPGSDCSSLPYDLRVVLNGSGLGAGAKGLELAASNSRIRGLVIQRFSSHGVVVTGDDNDLSCNYVGINSAGTNDLGNGGIGIYLNQASNTLIRGNVVSGNGSYGMYISGPDNELVVNRVGLNAAGTAAIPNDEEGILIQDGLRTIVGQGGTGSPSLWPTALQNVISGNKGYGISVAGNSQNTVIGWNRIGTNSTGTGAIPNQSGVYVGSVSVTVGPYNLLSGNTSSGVIVASTNTKILSNRIGVGQSGAKLANGSYGVHLKSSFATVGRPDEGNIVGGNGQDGIFIESGAGNVIAGNYIGTNTGLAANQGNGMFGIHHAGGKDNTVGGSDPGAANHIFFNVADGVYVSSSDPDGLTISRNAIHQNGGLGIDLGQDGVTPNDAGDPDTGANLLQNYPILTAVTTNGGATQFAGTLNSLPNRSFRVEFFLAGGCDSSGYGEGRGYIGFAEITTDGAGNAPLAVVLPTGVSFGAATVATATDSAGNTSEFSQCRIAAAGAVRSNYLPFINR